MLSPFRTVEFLALQPDEQLDSEIGSLDLLSPFGRQTCAIEVKVRIVGRDARTLR